jgi:hypothetical protein
MSWALLNEEKFEPGQHIPTKLVNGNFTTITNQIILYLVYINILAI